MDDKVRTIKTLDDLLNLCKEIGVKVKLKGCGDGIWWYANWCSGRCSNYRGGYLEVIYTSFKPTERYVVPFALYVLEGEGFIKILKMEDPPKNCEDFGRVFQDAIVEIIKK